MRETVGAIERLPGVQAAALTTNHSLDAGFTNSIAIEGRPDDPLRGEPTTRMVTPGYFDVAGVQVLEGRVFTDADTHDRPGAVVLNQTAAERYFPGGDALGSHISFWGLGFREIVGIVRDERLAGLRATPPPAFYTSLLQTPTPGGALTFMVRTNGEPTQWAAPVRRTIAAVDPELAIYDVTTMDATLAAAQRRERFATSLLGIFAVMALILAGTGVYGVLSYAVARRRKEMGIRLALGADAGRLKAMVVRQGAGLVGAGLLVGLATARIAARSLAGLLFGIDADTLLPYALSGALLLAVALVAAYLPARRAGAVAPAESLRAD
jgi:predicted permease